MDYEDEDDYFRLSAHEFGFQTIMDHRLHLLSLQDIMHIGMLTKATNRMYPPYLQQIAHKISVSNGGPGMVNVAVFTKDKRRVFNKTLSVKKVENMMNCLRRIGICPQQLDIKNYNHEPSDPVIEFIHKITSYRELALHPSCSCPDGCLELNNFTLSDIHSISPQTFLSMKKKYGSSDRFQGLNSLHIEASLPTKCSDLSEIQAAYNTVQKQPPHSFVEELNCMTRVLHITGVNRYSIDRMTLDALVNKMRVEELHMTPEVPDDLDDEQFSYKWSRYSSYKELQFAVVPRNLWDEDDPKIRVNKLFYVSSERSLIAYAPSMTVQKLCAWFQTKRETNISFERPRTCDILVYDLRRCFPIMIDADTPLLTLAFVCALFDDQTVDRTSNVIVKAFHDDDFFLVPSSWRLTNDWLQFDIKKRSENIVRIFISFVREPPKPDERPPHRFFLFRQGLEWFFEAP